MWVLLTNTDVDLAEGNLVGDLVNSSQAGRALTVQAVAAGSVGDTGPEGTHTSLGGSTTGGENSTDSNILDELGVDLGLGENTLEGPAEQLLGSALSKTTFLGLGDGGSESRDDNDCEVTKKQESMKMSASMRIHSECPV